MQLGFIGTGVMGNPMAAHLLEAGHALTVHDIDRDAAANLLEAGATWADTAAQAAAGAEVVLLSLPTPDVVDAVARSVVPALAPGAVLVDLSTCPPGLEQDLAALAEAAGAAFLDAPVSGGQGGARRGTLSVIVGGPTPAFERCRPLFEAIGENVYHMGDVGTGQATKLVNNMMCFVHMWTVVEAITLGTAAGVDPNLLRNVINTSSGASWVWRGGARAILEDRLEPTFDLTLVKKDMRLARELAATFGVPTAMAERADALIDEYLELGYGDRAIFNTIERMEAITGVSVRGAWKAPD